jgi:hypothetical protein
MAESEERNGTDSRNGTINDDGSSNILTAVIERRGKTHARLQFLKACKRTHKMHYQGDNCSMIDRISLERGLPHAFR